MLSLCCYKYSPLRGFAVFAIVVELLKGALDAARYARSKSRRSSVPLERDGATSILCYRRGLPPEDNTALN